MDGNIAAGLGIGIDAQVQARQSFNTHLIKLGLPGFQIPGIIIIGPEIALDAEADLGISLQGQVLAGVNMSIPNFSAKLDLVNTAKSYSNGFTPQLKPFLEAKAQISAHADFGLPVSFGIGIDIPALKFRKMAAITERPSIGANMTYTASTTCTGITEDDTCVNGVAYGINFVNDVYVNLFGTDKYDLYNVTIPITNGCKYVGGPSSCSSSTVAPVATDAFGDPLINYFTQPYSQYTAAMSYVGAAPIVAAVPTDAFGDPLINPFNTIGAPAPVTQTATIVGAPAAEIDAFGNPFDSPYSPNEKDAGANSSSFQDLSAAALANVDAQAPTTNATEFTNSTDSSFITIPDLENQYAIFANDETGNLEIALAADGSRFVSEGGYVVGDESRFFHFYPDVMQEYGVSRIRLSNASEIPKTSHFISLTPVNYNDNNETENVYTGVDTLANYYFLATCNIQNQASKVFLVADPEEGLTKLLDEQLRFTVTGGVVEVCYFISWAQPPSPAALQPGSAILPVIESISAAPPSPISAVASGVPPASTDASSLPVTSTSAPEAPASEPAAASSATPAAVSAPEAASSTPPAAPSSIAAPPAQTASAENTSGEETGDSGNSGTVDSTGNSQNTDSAPQTPDVADVGPVQVGA